MNNIKLKNCPNCQKRIGIQDIECPFCKYIDDPKYKKYNKNLKKNKKDNPYKIILFIPIITYLLYLLLNTQKIVILVPIILLSFMCFFVKKTWVFGVIIIEFIIIFLNLINNIYQVFISNSKNNILIDLIIFLLGLLFIITPKIIYLIKVSKKRKRKK